MLVLSSLFAFVFSGWVAAPAGAQTLDDIASQVDRNGIYQERDLEDVAADAVARANEQGVGFVYLDQENAGDLPIIAAGLLERLEASGSTYRSLIVLDSSGVWVQSADNDAAAAAVDAATPDFARGAIAAGVDTVVDVLGGGTEVPADAEGSDDAATTPAASTSSSDGGVPWLWIILLGIVAFFAVRFLVGRRRKAATLQKELAEDRAEIREQLRNNADHVIDLGDRIANADDELRRLYEDAAQTFQDVSLGLDDAATAVEIDALDDRLDRAEWQFDVIEARLDGRTPPPEPHIGDDAPPAGSRRPGGRRPVPSLGGDAPSPDAPRQPTGRSGRSLGDDRPALGDDESVFPGGSGRSRRTAPQQQSSRRGGGMLGGLAKAGLMSLVMRLLLGGGLGGGSTSRRTQQRRGYDSSSRGGGIGGGVLR